MRDIASRFAVARVAAVIAVLTTATVAIAVQTADAATVVAPKITTSYTPNQIGVTQTTGVTYTITDPNSLYQLSFTDTLPSTSTIDDPPSLTDSGCGSTPTITAAANATTVYAAGITIKAGTPCTISVAVVGNTAGTESDALSDVLYTSSSASYATPGPLPAAIETPAPLQVLGAPTITVKLPKNKAVYTYGEVVKASYSCLAATGDIQSELICGATDDLENTINSGGKLDTKAPGKHQLDVEATSGLTGATTDVYVNYTVLPDSAFTISKVKASNGTLSFALALPGAGKAVISQASGHVSAGGKTVTVKAKKTVSVRLSTISGATSETLKVTYTPKGGVKRTETKRITL